MSLARPCPVMKTRPSDDLRFVLGTLLALAVLGAFILGIHLAA